ncbi:MAG: UDP-N-acetylmuramate dehydrogenase [Deltaproteobacteria bacterium]|nr:UDP-N-acetylmuramate dehydrogenase [Deltaproteobacteria bacterium]
MTLSLDLKNELQSIAKGRISFDEPMRDHTTIKIGGPADIWFEPLDLEDLKIVTACADRNDIPKHIFGNGSNTLVRDKGIRGMAITLSKFDWINKNEENIVCVGAGVHLQRLLGWSVENSLSGLEELAGIPGTVGGAVIMNAGTKDGSIGDVVKNLKWASKGRVYSAEKGDLEFSYRKLKLPRGAIVFEISLGLKPSGKQEIESKIEKIRHRRKEIQPLLWPSLGSVFKNPASGSKAWGLIDDCNLRGVRVGGARISNEHANWIVNEGNATAKDVEVLIKMVKERVKEKSDVILEPEIVIIGE